MKIPAILLSALLVHPSGADQIRDFWFSGAEISSYTLSQARYGKNHPGHVELIFVTEPFLTEKQVKNENGGSPSTNVLKLNALSTFNTGIYPYRTMTTTFLPLDREEFPLPLKSTTTVQDWCGQTFQQANLKNGEWHIEMRSYFEGQADQEVTLAETHLEDGLWLSLRLNPESLPTGDIKIIPGAIYTRFHLKPIEAQPATATLKPDGEETTYRLHYPELDRTLSIRFDRKFPHIIRGWTEKVGELETRATLNKRLMNVNYWDMKSPEDTKKRKELGLRPTAN